MKELLREDYDLEVASLEPLTGGRMNHLFRCGEWVVKAYDHDQVPRERAERALQLQGWAAAQGLPVPAPRLTRSGALWAEGETGMVAVIPFVTGVRRARGTLTATEAASFGTLLGQLHEALRSAPLPLPARTAPLAPTTVLTRWADLRHQAQALMHPTDFDRVLMQMAEYVAAVLPELPPDAQGPAGWQYCHGDIHLDNLLFDTAGQVAALLDFDNAAPGLAGTELITAWQLCFSQDAGCLALSPEAGVFLKAYSAVRGEHQELQAAVDSYLYMLLSNTWPAALRFRTGAVHADWTELISLRFRAAQWLEAHRAEVSTWLWNK